MDILNDLNDKQLEAVRETEGFVRVIAGAGSGKTKLLVSRYAYLVKDYGIDSYNILCVTFTNKAAGEMKRRIRALIGPEYDTTLICTYHGFCARLLRTNPEKLFLNKSFQIIDTSQQKAILEEIYRKYELKLDHASFESMLKKIGYVKRNTDYVPKMCSSAGGRILPDVSTDDNKIIEDYLQRQKAIYALDFHDLINFAIYLLETDSDVRTKWQERLNYIMVDEFQDSSAKEMRLVDILSGMYKNVMIVGDPDQNIYEWRGSDVKLLVNFDTLHTPTQTIFLNRNYRSTPQILSCANSLIDKNSLRLKKDLFTLSPPGAEVIHFHSKSDSDETKIISDTIKDLVKDKLNKYSDIAVLYRSGFLSRVVEKRLTQTGIPYEIVGGVKFYQRMEVLDLIAYLKLIAFDDDNSFRRIINKPRRKFGSGKMSALEELRERETLSSEENVSQSLFSTLKAHSDDNPFKNSNAPEFVNFIEEMRIQSESLRISELVNKVSEASGYEQYIRELGDEERFENLAEFKRIANEFEANFGEDLSLIDFLQQLALQSDEDDDKPRDAVKLMTIHSAKGLEFPVVFIVGLTEGIFPSSKTIEERKKPGLEEERRLCYVAITRAKDRLFLMDSEGYSQAGAKKLPSRFLNEIGTNNYTRVGLIDEELAKESLAYVNRSNEQLDERETLKNGDEVEHHIFGKGLILSVDGRRGSCLVKFDRLPQPRNISIEYFKNRSSGEPEKTEPQNETSPETTHISDETPENPVGINIASDEKSGMAPVSDQVEEQEAAPSLGFDADVVKPSDAPSTADADEPENVVSDANDEYDSPDLNSENSEDPTVIFSENDRPDVSETAPCQHEMNDEKRAELQRKLEEADNLWKRDDVPHSGWSCIGISDLGEPVGICEMCGYQIIRYVHHMAHPNYRYLNVGCICAGKMEGNPEAARKRERDFKNRQARLKNFRSRKWKTSKNNNLYAKIKNHIVVLYKINPGNGWKYSIDNVFCKEKYESRDSAVTALFEMLEQHTEK